MYLDKINSLYEIDKLERAYQDVIDSNKGNASIQRSITDMMKEQLSYLKNKEQLTQYDVDRANALLQIEIKRLALEQQRENKTKLRLRRDTQGNYTYQYVSDDDEVKKVQEEISDLYNQLYNLDVDRYTGNLDQLYEIWME